jgi:hypothetical protein
MRSKRWYQKHLEQYFKDHYFDIEDEVEFYVDPDVNQWKFIIPETGLRVTLVCGESGAVLEEWEVPEEVN